MEFWKRVTALFSKKRQPTTTQVKAVTTAQAKGAATPEAQKHLRVMADTLLQLESRDERQNKLIELKKTANKEALTFLDLTSRREKEHYHLINVILPQIDELNTQDRGEKHDHSKDDLFYFAAACYYDGGLQQPDMKEFVDSELKRHHTLEPHHPEYEKYNNKECSDQDILEMAVDRLCRNAQFGDGIVRLDSLKKFTPTFTMGDNEVKQKLFLDYADKYQELVQNAFYKMYPDAKEWSVTKS